METLKTVVIGIIIVSIFIGIFAGIIYIVNRSNLATCNRYSDLTEFPTELIGGVCYVEIYGVKVGRDDIDDLLPYLLTLDDD